MYPQATPNQISTGLAKFNISTQYAAKMKNSLKRKQSSNQSKHFGYDAVLAAATFIKKCGGIREAKVMLKKAESLLKSV